MDALVARGAREQSVDLVTAPAVPPPLMVIAEVSGVPAERWAEFRRRGRRNGATAGSAGAGEGLPGPTGGTDPAALRLDPGDEPARAQISLAVSTLLRRAGGLRLTVAPQDVPRRRAHCIRTPLRLPVTLTVAERGRE
ncbi:hypothetical protein [Streptomyces bohaiensis]|uniref:Uncharacterized protein n=1 Tax=Streptomyces bohaiensis TaxID=1431344 RepID=A0ABX1C994_9ACTN|nr:hypothetical protein [Streptomyces bohaiensis]NJQ13807.1 hypothetical protein [Streptomyces bohaiensis]